MGLLTQGRPLTWEETKNYTQFIREHGIEQFLQIYNKIKDRRNDCLKWGDEVEQIDQPVHSIDTSLCLGWVFDDSFRSWT